MVSQGHMVESEENVRGGIESSMAGWWSEHFGAGGAGMSLRSAWPVGLEVSFVFSGCCVPEICRYVLPSCRLWSSVGSSYRRLVGAVVSCGVRDGCRYVISLELSSEVMGVVSTVVSSSESCLSFLLSCLRLRRLLQPAAAGVLHRVVVESVIGLRN